MLILVTRPEPQASEWVAALQALGEQAAALPLIEIGAPGSTQAVEEAWRHLATTRLVMFVSPNAASWFARLRPPGTLWPPGTLAAAPGPGTVQAVSSLLADAGLRLDQILSPPAHSEQFDSEHLWPVLSGHDWQGQDILVVSGGESGEARGRQWLTDRLQAAGGHVRAVLAYQRGPACWTSAHQALARRAREAPASHLWLLSSSQAVAYMSDLLGQMPSGACAVATHPRVADSARLAGFKHVNVARPLPEAVAQARRSLQGTVDTMNSP